MTGGKQMATWNRERGTNDGSGRKIVVWQKQRSQYAINTCNKWPKNKNIIDAKTRLKPYGNLILSLLVTIRVAFQKKTRNQVLCTVLKSWTLLDHAKIMKGKDLSLHYPQWKKSEERPPFIFRYVVLRSGCAPKICAERGEMFVRGNQRKQWHCWDLLPTRPAKIFHRRCWFGLSETAE